MGGVTWRLGGISGVNFVAGCFYATGVEGKGYCAFRATCIRLHCNMLAHQTGLANPGTASKSTLMCTFKLVLLCGFKKPASGINTLMYHPSDRDEACPFPIATRL